MPALGLALGLPFSQRLGGPFPSGVVQWLSAPDSDGAITDKRSLLSRPVYTGNNCKRWDGNDKCESSATLNIGAQDFEMGLEMRLDNLSQSKYRPYFGRWSPDGVDYAGNVSIYMGGGSIVYAFVKSHEGTQKELGYISTATLGTTLFHTFLLKRVGTKLTFYVDGVAKGSVTYPATDTFMVDRNLGYRGGPCTRSRAWVDVAGVRVVDYTHAAGPALVEWDRSGNGNHGVYTTTSGIDTMATMDDNATPWNILNGFSLYTHATLPVLRVPYDINGDPISITPPTGYTLVSEHPGGYLHNGAESTITQTDNFFIDGTINFYSADGATQDDKTYADFLAHEPFKDNLLLQWKSVGGVCLGCEAMQLPLAYTWTKAKYNAALAFMHKFTSDCGAKIFTVTEPTGGWLRTYDPNTATAGDAYDFLATLVHDMHTGFPTYAVTEPTGGWVRTFDTLDADLTLGTVQDVLATVAHDIGSTVQAYALNTGGTELYTYNPNTATFNNAANVLYSLMLKLKHFGFIL